MADDSPKSSETKPSTEFTSDPPKKPTLAQVTILFVYHVVLGVLLAYLVYNIWPPLPWPGDARPKPEAGAGAKTGKDEIAAKTNPPSGEPKSSPSAVASPASSSSSPGPSPASTASPGTGTSSSPGAGKTGAGSGAAASPSPSPSPSASTDSGKTDEAVCKDNEYPRPFSLFGKSFCPTLEVRLILLVMLVGAIGSYIHAASSFTDYLGNRTFVSSWVWWYLLRPFIGMLLALLFYFVFRGGFITAGVNSEVAPATAYINPFGIAAMAGLVGMFSKVAADKLSEVFLTLFRPAPGQGDAKRGDKLSPPTISNVSTNKGPESGGTSVTITGTGFGAGAKVRFGGVLAQSVSVAGPTSLVAVTPPHAAETVTIEVVNPDGQKSSLLDAFTFEKPAV
jgi:hypothetical protein